MMRSDFLIRLSATLLAAVLAVLSVQAFYTRPIAGWTVFSLSVFLALMALGVGFILARKFEFFAGVGALFASLVIGRLFSTMHFELAVDAAGSALDPLMIAETGPGIDSIMWVSAALAVVLSMLLMRFAWRQSHDAQPEDYIGRPTLNDWGLTFIRIYVGLMFIAHFAGHLFAGPAPFAVFTEYFGSIGLPAPADFVILAGVIELAVSIGLAFGLLTRVAAVGAAIYLFVSVWLGGHFAVGYIWVLPTGGWEFPALWIFTVSIFALTGGGPASLDRFILSKFADSLPLPRAILS